MRSAWVSARAQPGGPEVPLRRHAARRTAGSWHLPLLACSPHLYCRRPAKQLPLCDCSASAADGRYCTVDAGYQGMLLELVLLTAVEHGWPLSALPGARVAAALEPHGYDPR